MKPVAPSVYPKRSWRPGLLLVLAVLMAYLPVWRAGFIWDDDVLVTANPCVVGPLGLQAVWTTKAADICPLTITTFWCEYKLWGAAPWPYHVVNVCLHAACAVLLWQVLRRLLVPGAWLGAALWALHPVQVESVGWITEMKNTQSGVFYLLAVLFFLRSREPRDRVLTVLCAALAMASKSSTVVLPVMLCLLAWWTEGRWSWRRVWEVAPIFLLSLAAAVLSVWSQTALHPVVGDGSYAARTGAQRLVMAGDAVWFYLGKLVWPQPLLAVYPRWAIGPVTALDWVPLGVGLVLLLVLWRQRWVWGRGGLLAGGYFLVALLPVLGLVEMSFFRYSFVADHFVYLASMGPMALLGAGVARLGAAGRWAVAAALILVLGMTTWERARAYENSETLWTDELAKDPRCWVGYSNLGVALAERGQPDAAIARYREALQIGPDNAKTHNNLGGVLLRQGRTDEAATEYREAARVDPGNAEARYNLGNLFLHDGQVDRAIVEFRAALERSDDYVAAYANLGAALRRKGQLDDAVAEYRRALRIDPGNVQNLNNLGNLFLQKGQVDAATQQYQAAIQADPNDPYTYRNLGNMLSKAGRLDQAIVEYQEALKLSPADAETRNNLGSAFVQKGLLEEAAGQYREAVRVDPGFAFAHRNLGLVLARQGRLSEAIGQFRVAVGLRPDFSEAQHDLAAAQAALATQGPPGVP